MDAHSSLKPAHNVPPYLGVTTSLSGRAWRERIAAKGVSPEILRELTHRLGLMNVAETDFVEPLARFAAGRGVTPEGLQDFIFPTLKALFPEPSCFMDMDKAVSAMLDALECKAKISIFADYDVDGATSAAQLVRWFRHMGHELEVYVPDRVTEGYGPSNAAFDTLKRQGTDLVVTVDCGAMAHRALDYAASIGLDVVVIDHHLMREEPPHALAVVNPNRPGCTSAQGNLAAAGVVFVVLAGLNREAEKRGLFDDRPKPDLRQWLDLSALGAICDVTALTGFNRALAAQGLKVMSQLKNAGIKALMEVAGDKSAAVNLMSTFHSGFVIGPRINAGGRVGRSDLGVRLLSTDDVEEAAALAHELDELNRTRRDIEAEVLDQAMQTAEAQGLWPSDDPVIVIAREDWHPGVIGIVAGRLRERWHKPVIIIGIDPVSGMGKGSGRSQAGVNLGEAVGAAFETGILLSGGGHAMAAGLSVERERIGELRRFINDYVTTHVSEADQIEAVEIDAILSVKAASRALYDRFDLLAPFGQGNPEPVLAFAGIRVGFAQAMKGGHIRFELSDDGGAKLKGIMWRAEGTAIGDALLRPVGLIHVVGRLKADDYMGRRGVQLEIEDIALA
ncbi:single-stranded-DNA-specific exonuclease RecJ [Asticcacaulis taihuensis]|jgi:single-stranded-DNA-specific exonuclease|uniref:Single-stranded-DNA-specific exonuclease RecJ n=1 Tax=Asticcacaulis taihuensis TaxID=260084 RepID=A0A1G4PKT9_9CAUL|nr:single-stranded-DNA-specific exonuclease RecJ [Asticcacaulis taihuensis]SCW32699.1 single-stranded-DNA-specific exonuclease [Asticcacaulis taihuensis]